MINSIIDFYKSSDIVPFFFWGAAVFNMFVYPIHLWARVQKDRRTVVKWREDVAEKQKEEGAYIPTLHDSNFVTIGTFIKYFFLTFTPVLNALATIFHAAPIAWEYLTKHLGWLLDLKIINVGDENEK